MIKWIIREVEPEAIDTSIMFDDDGLKAISGFENTLMIIQRDYGREYGFNYEDYSDIVTRIESFVSDFTENRDPGETRKSVMQRYEIAYTPSLCHALTKYAERVPYISSVDQVADFLTLTTGKEWKTHVAHGYCQGDYATILYCAESYPEWVIESYGDYYFGCCKEFCVIDVDSKGIEHDCLYGFFVADSELGLNRWGDYDLDYKQIVCSQAGINMSETTLQLIDDCKTVTNYSYREV